MVYPDESLEAIATPFRDDHERMAIAAIMREHLRLKKAVAYSFVFEGWQATLDRSEPLGETKIRDRPDKREVVIAIATDGLNQKMRLWGIVRDRRGRCKALLLEDEGAPTVGWATNLLGGTA